MHNRGNQFIEGGNVFINSGGCIISRHNRGVMFLQALAAAISRGVAGAICSHRGDNILTNSCSCIVSWHGRGN